MEWKDQYKHPNWQKKRLECLEDASFECSSCGSKENQLHVHHKQYFKGRKIWDYSLDELVVLCATCHESAHSLNDEFKESLVKADVGNTGQALGYLTALNAICGDELDIIQVPSVEFAHGIADAIGITEDEVIGFALANERSVSISALLDIKFHGGGNEVV